MPNNNYTLHTERSTIAVNAYRWWDKLSRFPAFPYSADFTRFYFLLEKSLPIVETPYGIIRCTDFQAHHRVSIHAWIWSSDALRNTGSLRHTVKMLPLLLGVFRVDAVIPHSRRALAHLLHAIGFTHEGTLRNYLNEGTIEDGDIYSVIRSILCRAPTRTPTPTATR